MPSAVNKKRQPSRRGAQSRWGATELSMLGRYPDEELAKITSRPIAEIIAKRESLGIKTQRG